MFPRPPLFPLPGIHTIEKSEAGLSNATIAGIAAAAAALVLILATLALIYWANRNNKCCFGESSSEKRPYPQDPNLEMPLNKQDPDLSDLRPIVRAAGPRPM